MWNRFVGGVVVALLAAGPAAADGCKYLPTGRLVPEREQVAFVEWADGVETLHVAVRSDPSADAVLWVVPVRGPAERVRAEPADETPTVVFYDRLSAATDRVLREWVSGAAMLDSGGCCLPFVFGGCAGAAVPTKSAAEVSRVERLGMVVTVVRADDRGELERYFDAQGVNRAAADLRSLEPYFGTGHAFVCGWVAARGELVTATGLKLVFPSPTVWFPLQPTAAYREPVPVAVYVRGHVRPAAGCDLPGLRCEYVGGTVETKPVRSVFARRRDDESPWNRPTYGSEKMTRLTRVTVAPDPAGWDRDLELEPGTTPVGTLAEWVVEYPSSGPPLGAAIGGLLGLLLPVAVFPRANRRRVDYLWGAAVGAGLAGTIWAAAVVFYLWRRQRWADGSGWFGLLLPVLAAAHFGTVWAACAGLRAWIEAAA